jgi:hypothetical protein
MSNLGNAGGPWTCRVVASSTALPSPRSKIIPEEDWRPLGEFDPITGRSNVDYPQARRWRPIEEFSRW